MKNAIAGKSQHTYAKSINKEGYIMALMDDLENKGKDLMSDPDMRAKIEQMAKDKGISLEEAKSHFMKHDKE